MLERLKALARRILGPRYAGVAEVVSHRRLGVVEDRIASLEHRTRRDVTAQLAAVLYEDLDPPPHRALPRHELQVFSQNGEDGIILRLLAVTGSPNRRLVEIGIGDGRECNSANLLVNWGWSGVLIEGDVEGAASAAEFHRDREGVTVENEFVTAERVKELVPEGPIDLLSIDIDGNDYWVWQAIDAEPRVVVIEYNASLGPTRSVTIPYDRSFDYTTASDHLLYHGASLTALTRLGNDKGMALVGCDSQGVNAFFVRHEHTTEHLPEVTPAEAWRPIRKRLRRWTQEEQEGLLDGFPFVEV